jgi:transcriptional regulator with XRE-family HTH domain
MNAAEYDTRRRALGLSIRDLAELHGCTERTINRRILGEQAVRMEDIDDIEQLEVAMDNAVDHVVKLAKAEAGRAPITLYRYRNADHQSGSAHAPTLPLGAHAMMISWALDALEAEGFDVAVEWAA